MATGDDDARVVHAFATLCTKVVEWTHIISWSMMSKMVSRMERIEQAGIAQTETTRGLDRALRTWIEGHETSGNFDGICVRGLGCAAAHVFPLVFPKLPYALLPRMSKHVTGKTASVITMWSNHSGGPCMFRSHVSHLRRWCRCRTDLDDDECTTTTSLSSSSEFSRRRACSHASLDSMRRVPSWPTTGSRTTWPTSSGACGARLRTTCFDRR